MTDFLSDYLAGELPQPVHREFDVHVRLCRDCKVFLVQFRETVAAGRIAFDPEPLVPVPEDLVQAIMRAVTRGRDHAD